LGGKKGGEEGFRRKPTSNQIVWTIAGKRKGDPQAEGTIVISCPTKLGEEKHINRVIIYGGSLSAGGLPIFSMEEPEQTAALKALEELGMIDQQSKDSTEVNDLKAKIWEAELAQRNFAAGLPHCNELNGANFYFYQRDRVLSLQDYRRSLDNLVAEGAFNSDTRRPWNKQDADARWAQVQKQATTDQANCAAVASLPSLRQKLKELEQRQSPLAGNETLLAPPILLDLARDGGPFGFLTFTQCTELQNTDVRFGSKAGIGLVAADVRFTPKSGHYAAICSFDWGDHSECES
jgi:hypothetical protein